MHRLSHLQAALTRARKVGVPLIAIQTADPASAIPLVLQANTADAASPTSTAAVELAWDSSQGLFGLSQAGREFLKDLDATGPLPLADALVLLQRLPENATAAVCNAHHFLDRPEVAQGIWNVRDTFKADGRLLVLLGPSVRLPTELSQDVLVLTEPLPGESELAAIVRDTYRHAELPEPEGPVVQSCVAACRGLSPFAAEQALALSLTRSGIDLPALWARKRQSIEQAPGLTFSLGGPGFESVGGLAQIKKLGAGLFAGPQPPRCVVRLDEIEKQVAGTQGDLTGIAQDMHAVLLRAIQDYGWSGLIAVGPPGSGKSLFSKVLGNEFQVPTLEIDLGACKGSLVGESEANIRQMLSAIYALSGEGGAFFIATCNSVTTLPAELRRRFRYGVWTFDLPSKEERESIWQLYRRRFEIPPDQPRPEDALFTGADIFNCCELAYRLGTTLQDASSYLLPVAKSYPEPIRQLRELADGRFLSASSPGAYGKPDDSLTPASPSGRRIEMEKRP